MKRTWSKMQHLKQHRMWIDGKCYDINLNLKKNWRKITDLQKDTKNSDEKKEKFSISLCDVSKLQTTSFRMPPYYYGKLNDWKRQELSQISNETDTEITYPNKKENGHINIKGKSEENVIQARDEVQSLLVDIRNRSRVLQFISIPVLSEEIQKNFIQFRKEILEGDPIQGVEESIFQSELKLHLTICVLCLMDDTEKEEAKSVLQNYKNDLFLPIFEKEGPLRIKVAGLSTMQENLKKTRVLYANASLVNEENYNVSLQGIANDIAKYFYERGLLPQYSDQVKLHVTLMNSKYRKSKGDSPNKKRWSDVKPFDATPIIEKYKDYVFGECDFNMVKLSLMSSISEDGFYESIDEIQTN